MNRQNKRLLGVKLRSRRPTSLTVLLTSVNLFFTALTVGMALFTAYFNFFRVSENLHARLTWSHSAPDFHGDSLSINVAIFNAGNRQALVVDLQIAQASLKGGKLSSWTFTPRQYTNPSLPLVVEPGRIALVQLSSAYASFDWYHNATECDSTEPRLNNSKCANLGIRWTAVNSRGQSFNGAAIVGRLSVDQKGINGIGMSVNEIDLFTNE